MSKLELPPTAPAYSFLERGVFSHVNGMNRDPEIPSRFVGDDVTNTTRLFFIASSFFLQLIIFIWIMISSIQLHIIFHNCN